MHPTIALLLYLLVSADPQKPVPFDIKCHPFQSIEVKRPIDSVCGHTGDAGTKEALALQDEAKDNFCAKGDPKEMQFSDYPKLQADAEKALGGPDYKAPQDRTALQKLGEGTLVRIVAFVDRARYSDVETGESVNCNIKGDESNDVHIPLLAKPGDDECTSVTAEASPHYRPNDWTPGNLNKQKLPVRITGQLLFDAEHRPCRNGKTDGPKRQSVWEVHPVYAIDLCTASNASDCVASNDKVWAPLK